MPGIQYDEYGRPVTPTFRTPMDFVAYVDSLGPAASAGARRQADEIRRNPGGWEMSPGSFGQPRPRPDWLARNLPWLGPAAVGGGALAAGLAGAGAAAAGGGSAPLGGLLPSSHLPAASLMGGPAAITSNGASALATGTAAGGGGATLGRLGSRALNAVTSREGAGALASLLPMLMSRGGGGGGDLSNLTANMPQLNALLDMTAQRAQRTDPLHQMVTQLAESRMPVNMRGGR